MHWSLRWNVVSLQELNKRWECPCPEKHPPDREEMGKLRQKKWRVQKATALQEMQNRKQPPLSTASSEWQQSNMSSAWLQGYRTERRKGEEEEKEKEEKTQSKEKELPLQKQTYRATRVLVWAVQLSQQQGRPPTPDVLQSLPALHRTIKRLQITMPAMHSPTGVSPLTCH